MAESNTTPPAFTAQSFTQPSEAVDRLIEIYDRNTRFLRTAFDQYLKGQLPFGRHRAYYPEIRFQTDTYARVDSRLSYGYVNQPGKYSTTITRPELFKGYLRHQLELLIANHDQPVEIGESDIPIPLHFALVAGAQVATDNSTELGLSLRDAFDVPDIADNL